MGYFSPSRELVAPFCAEDEGLLYAGVNGADRPLTAGNYGAGSVVIDPSADCFYTENSPTPFKMDVGVTDPEYHDDTLSREKSIIGVRLWRIDMDIPLMGGTSAAGQPRYIDVLTAAGLDYANPGGTPNSLMITPASLSKQRSSVMQCEYDGALHTAEGVVGTFSIMFRVGEEPVIKFSGFGLYNEPTLGTMTAPDPGEKKSKAFIGATGGIRSVGSLTNYGFTLQSAELVYQAKIGRIPDALDTSNGGLKMLVATSRKPTLKIEMAMDVDSAANLTYPQIYSNLTNSTGFDLYWQFTDLWPRTHLFSFPKAQPVGIDFARGDGVRNIALNLTLPRATSAGDNEFYWLQS